MTKVVGVCYALFSFFVIILTTFALSLDVRHLNPALLLKWLLFESRVRGRYIQIFDVERISWSAITSTGSECVRPYSFELWFHFVFYWRLTCILMTMYLAELGYTIASASTLAIEARHAAWINSTVRKGNPPTTGFASSLFTSRPFSN